MTNEDFSYICKLVQERSAIVLEPGKEYLVEMRLAPLAQQLQLGGIPDLVARLKTAPDNGLYTRVVEAMTTNETLFFRDHHPYEALRKVVIPDLIQRRQDERRLTIWSAACSTGQEPYSVALLLKEHFPELARWQVTILATDLSREVLEKARAGRYTQMEVNRGMPVALLVKHFRQHGTSWQLNDDVRRMVTFQEANLALPFPALMPRPDLVLLRNVLIYFSVETKKAILGRVARVLRPDGYLLLGSAETTFHLDDGYRRVEHLKGGFYQFVG
jgi:chemotaxis protein methyltransferase CheR